MKIINLNTQNTHDLKNDDNYTNYQYEFILKALQEVQEQIKYLDTKIGVAVIFYTTIFATVINYFEDFFTHNPLDQIPESSDFKFFILIGLLSINVILLVIQVIVSVLTILPQESPADHIDLNLFSPKNLFYINSICANKITPSVHSYKETISQMTTSEILSEYIYEIEKLSYIRIKKSKKVKVTIITFLIYLLESICLIIWYLICLF